jgi:tetratricopeptide (TPR) repeat protein
MIGFQLNTVSVLSVSICGVVEDEASVLSVALVRLKAPALSVALVLVFCGSAAAQRADLAKARAAYNQQQFDEAIDAAQVARKFPATSDAATVVLARAYLERYRQRANPGDLAAARVSLGTVRVTNLDSRDHVDFLMALGEALFFEDEFGAAAALFESSLDSAIAQGPSTGEAMLDWWGSAIERQADALEREQRAAVFVRLRERMTSELARHPGSAAAAYWVVVGTRGAGDPHAAWDAAVAGWVRARLAGSRSATLRADLDKLVLEGIIPDRVRSLPADRRGQAESDFRTEWAVVKERWK